MSRIITVVNATGTQGSSVIAAILADGTFTPRAISRNASSPASQKLAAQGVQVVEATVSRPETLVSAIKGSECVFAVTYEPSSPDDLSEFEQGKRIVEASKAANVKFVLWSSLPSSTKLSGGKYKNVTIWDDKARVDDVLVASGLPHAILHTGFFASNLWKYPLLARHPETGKYRISIPHWDPSIPQLITWIERDLGPAAVAVFKNYNTRPELVLNQTFVVGTERMVFYKLIEIASKAAGEPVEFSSEELEHLQDFNEVIDFTNDFKPYNDQIIPDPRLLELGAPNLGGLDEKYVERLKEHIARQSTRT